MAPVKFLRLFPLRFFYFIYMKKIIFLVLLLSLCAFAVPLFETNQGSENDSSAVFEYSSNYEVAPSSEYVSDFASPKKHVYRNSFYMALELGFVYTSLSGLKEVDYRHDELRGSFKGFGWNANYKMGILFKELATAHVLFGLFNASGTYKLKERKESDWSKRSIEDVNNQHLTFGIGSTIYPFRDAEDSMNGFYLGADVALEIGFFDYEDDSDDYDSFFNKNAGFVRWQLEIGKDFNTSKRWKLGVGLSFAMVTSDEKRYQNIYSLMFRVVRR